MIAIQARTLDKAVGGTARKRRVFESICVDGYSRRQCDMRGALPVATRRSLPIQSAESEFRQASCCLGARQMMVTSRPTLMTGQRMPLVAKGINAAAEHV